MKLHQKLSLYIVVLIVLASLATEAFASCPASSQGPPCQEFWQADAVFIGTATRFVGVPNETQLMIGPYSQTTTHFTVEEGFRGIEGTAVVIEANHCGYLFKEGQRYLVYAHRNGYTKKLEVRLGTTRTRPLSEATEDLAYIRSLASAPAGLRIFGKVFQQGYKETKTQVEPLRDVRVLLEKNDERYEVVTDSEGRFEFKGLSAGNYRIRVEVPSHLEFRELTFNATGNGCLGGDLYALHKGEIAGKVLDTNGKPVRDVGVTLVSADAKPEHILSTGKDKTPGPTSYTGRDGTYSFSQLMPGRYLLILNRDFGSSRSELVRGLPQLFYPGVNDLAAATVIVVTPDRKRQAYDFVLPIQQ